MILRRMGHLKIKKIIQNYKQYIFNTNYTLILLKMQEHNSEK